MPEFDAADIGTDNGPTSATITASVQPLVRLKENPIVKIEDDPTIRLVD